MYDRRTFLQRAGLATTAGAALVVGAPRPAPAQDAELAPFLHGVASGDPVADGVLLWTRISGHPSPVDVNWRVATDVGMASVVATGSAIASAESDHTLKVSVSGLQPATWYFYEFEAAGRRSIIGRTKTAPLKGVTNLRFGVVSCSNYQGGFFNAYARLAERQDLDAIIHLGDYLYEYGNGEDRYGPGVGELSAPRDHQPPTEMVSLTDYRARHSMYKLDPDLRRLHQLFPWIVTWDDHESTNNSHRDGAENHDVGEGDWAVRKAAAQRAYAEWMPIRADDPSKVYRTLRYGDLADIIVMDTRLDGRDPEVGTVGATIVSGEEIDDPERNMVSAEQRAIVFDALTGRDTVWKVIAQQVILGQWNAGGAPQLPDAADRPRFVVREEGNALNPDQWDGYTAERSRLFSHIRENDVPNVVVLTGDVHTSWALELTEDPYNPVVYNPLTGSGAIGVEFVTPSVTSANFASLGPVGVAAFEAVTLADNPHVKYVDFEHHGYFILDLTPERVRADWFHVGTVLRPDVQQLFAAGWESPAGGVQLTSAPQPAPDGLEAPSTPHGVPRGSAPVRGGPVVEGETSGRGVLAATGPASSAPAVATAGALALVGYVIRRRMARALPAKGEAGAGDPQVGGST